MFPEVGSITTLCPGISLPSLSAASTILFAIRSFTDPPADVYSTFPTVTMFLEPNMGWKSLAGLTKVALEAFCLSNPIQSDKRCTSNSIESAIEYLARHDEKVMRCWKVKSEDGSTL